jgi:hypothetical protein
MNRRRFGSALCVVAAMSSIATIASCVGTACTSSNSEYADASPIFTDAGLMRDRQTPLVGGEGGTLKPFPVGGPPDPGAGAFYVTISGESNAIDGYPFPPFDYSTDTYMYDGWQFEIEAYIVIVDKITLWSDPSLSPTNQSLHGPAVAELTGPFVIDLHKGGAIIGQGGSPEQATPIGVLTNQNLNGGAAFDPTLTYGFGFSTIPAGMPYPGYTGEVAGYDAYNVNLTPDEDDDYAYMVAHGASVYYRGHAVWLGEESGFDPPCSQTNAGAGVDAGLVHVDGGPEGGVPTYVDGGYDFTLLPEKGMNFRFAFSTPTNYVNCQNYTMPGMGIGGESSPRGVQVNSGTSAIAQVTVHMDHPFWQSFAEDTPVHWDDIAAQYVGVAGPPDGGFIESHIDDFHGVPFQPFTDHTGTPLPWRDCSGGNYMPPGNGAMFFTTLSVPVCPGGTNPAVCIRDYYDYIRYAQSTQGHLNSQGLCYIDRQFPSPSGGS